MTAPVSPLGKALLAFEDHLFALPVLVLAAALSLIGVVLALAHLPADPRTPAQPAPADVEITLPAPSA